MNSRVNKLMRELREFFAHLDADIATHAIDTETFPMRSWDYNHIIGYIRITASKRDILFDVFLPVPYPKHYVWTTTRKYSVQNIGANGTHIYWRNLKNNAQIREAVDKMVTQITTEHIPSRFHIDREAFDAINEHLDYLSILRSE